MGLLLLGLPASAEPQWITHRSQGWQLEPPPAIRQGWSRYDPTFRPWRVQDYLPYVQRSYHYTSRQLPFAVAGDFNGDGQLDLLVEGRTRNATVRLASLSPEYKALEQWRGPLKDPARITYEVPGAKGVERQTGLWVYLERLAPGILERPVGQLPALRLTHDGFKEVYLEKTTIYYRFHQGGFQEIYNSD